MVKSNPRESLIDLNRPEQGVLQIDVHGAACNPKGVNAIRKDFIQAAIVTLAPSVHRVMGEGNPWFNRPKRIKVPTCGRFVGLEDEKDRLVCAVGEMLVDVRGPLA